MTSTAHRHLGKAAPAAARPVGSAVLDRAIDAAEARRAADVALLEAATEWAETHPVPAAEVGGYARWEHPSQYGEGAVPVAGDGAPLVAEFAADQLAAALGWPVAVARSWMGDGLELKYRLPTLHRLTVTGAMAVHLARYAAEQTRDLPLEAARHADRLLAESSARLTRARIRGRVDEARLYHDPDRAVDDEQTALASRTVELWPGQTPATTEVHMRLDTLDADAFDRAVNRTAQALKALGDTDPLDLRRARAVGVLADPRRALDLLTAGTDRGRTGPGRTRPGAGGPVLWLHLTADQLLEIDTFPAAIHTDRFGTPSSDLVKLWLTDTTVTIKPVLDPARADAVDAHDPPDWMADLVRLRDPCCVFPGCQRPSRACDLDHIDPYLPLDRGGPPGQTAPANLAPLCRRHHRAKTHAGWTYHRRPDGSYHWTSPTGHTHTVPPTRHP